MIKYLGRNLLMLILNVDLENGVSDTLEDVLLKGFPGGSPRPPVFSPVSIQKLCSPVSLQIRRV